MIPSHYFTFKFPNDLWCWRRLPKVPWTARRPNQSILKEINPEYSLEGLMLKLKLQYFGHLMQELTHWIRPWCWERLRAGGEGTDRGGDGWMHHWFNGHEFEETSGDLKDKEVGCVTVHEVAKNQTGLSNWTTTTMIYDVEHFFIFLSSVYLIKSLLIYFTHFLKIQMLAFLLLNFMISLYVLDNNH